MPLAKTALKSALESLFSNPPADAAGCAQQWGSAVQSYAAGIVPASTAVSAAASALTGSLATAFAAPDAAPSMESAFATFAAAVGVGMAAAGFAPTPPPAPVGFAPQFAGPKPGSASDAADQISTLIDRWLKTGIGTLIAPPNTPMPWS